MFSKKTSDISQHSLLHLEDVGVTIDGLKILEHVSFRINKNEVVSLIGPNGAGKSTLIKVILQLIKPTYGIVKYAAHLRIGYVPQKTNWSDSIPYTVDDFLKQTIMPPPRTVTPVQREVRFKEILHETGVIPLLNYSIHHLSGGERQRVLLARALLCYPDLLILDEPMQGLDLQSEADLYQYIQVIPQRYACSIFIVSHDIHWVMQGTDRVICLNHHICCSGTPNHVQGQESYKALFEPYRLPYVHNHDHCQHHNLLSPLAIATAQFTPVAQPVLTSLHSLRRP